MAALVDTSIPEITRQISRDRAEEVLEPDVIVKSKPRPVVDLMQQQQQNGVEEDGEPEHEIEPDVVVKSKPRPLLVDLLQDDESRPTGPRGSGSHTEEPSVGIQLQTLSSSPTSSTPMNQQASSLEVRQKRVNGDIGRGDKENQVAPSQAVAKNIDQVAVKKEEEFEDSTAMLLRRYTGSRSGRQGHIPITSTGEIGGSVSLKETFRVGGRSCTVQLEEDYIGWIPNGKKDSEQIKLIIILISYPDHPMFFNVAREKLIFHVQH